ncbi:MAG: DUF3467 domain-containing protein [Acetobacteraceae bacterium]|nr:DUF3467 domain-containing protein [Pseudomonadota bacterium]
MNDEVRPHNEAATEAPQSTAIPPAGQPAAGQPPGAQPRVRFDTSNLKSSYCNVCNATSTREEVVVNFGINQTWDMQQRDLDVQLLHRVILSPYAAKRLHDLLGKLIKEHESRYGELR